MDNPSAEEIDEKVFQDFIVFLKSGYKIHHIDPSRR